RPWLLFLATFWLVSCSGYQLGGRKPSHLSGIETLYVPLAQNDTLFPRLETHMTNEMVSALVQDGTYRVGRLAGADAKLQLRVSKMSYRQIRSNNEDTLRSEELELEVFVKWTLHDLGSQPRLLDEGMETGRTRFFVDANLQTARRNAVPDAVQRAAQDIVSRLADGF
ncbi:MAG: LPS assembly lipoprotein LptE, partial [Verrucomicrobiales bacterium]